MAGDHADYRRGGGRSGGREERVWGTRTTGNGKQSGKCSKSGGHQAQRQARAWFVEYAIRDYRCQQSQEADGRGDADTARAVER